MPKIYIINGANLNLLGKREPHIYGSTTFEEFFNNLKEKYGQIKLAYFQSNHEGALVDKLHEIGFEANGIILNAGAFTHTSVALADAVAAIPAPVIEVHISNIFAREPFRHHSYLSPYCKGIITGLGLKGYELALQYLLSLLNVE
ncbi:MAG: type II 3-dehydroquinate dehydratase [Microscillaceae bacterium]|nr:type II 3-dehydroquinate dehydratase [Microscillaceae bacterium]MDW8459920.1 type II 3-dehydroquinate dehydratase [Cytophagales bacterium]